MGICCCCFPQTQEVFSVANATEQTVKVKIEYVDSGKRLLPDKRKEKIKVGLLQVSQERAAPKLLGKTSKNELKRKVMPKDCAEFNRTQGRKEYVDVSIKVPPSRHYQDVHLPPERNVIIKQNGQITFSREGDAWIDDFGNDHRLDIPEEGNDEEEKDSQ